MGTVEIDLSEGNVAVDHLQGGVAEKALELEGVAAVP